MLRFLLIDDSPGDAQTLMFCIEQDYGGVAQCEVASSLEQALSWLDPEKHEPFDAVLLDLNLPDSPGDSSTDRAITTFRTVKQATAARVPIVVWSGRDDERGLVDLLIDEGAENYLYKGEAKSKQVFETLRDAVKRRRSTARISGREAKHIEESDVAARQLIDGTSGPPRSADRLRSRAIATQSAVVRDLATSVAVMREQLDRLEKDQNRAAEERDTLRTRSMTQEQAQETLKGRTSQLEVRYGRLRDLSLGRKRLLGFVAFGLCALGYLLGERELVIRVILTFFGLW